VQRAVRAKTRLLLVERMRVALLLALASLSFFLAQDLLLFRPRVVPLTLIKGVQFTIVFTVLWLIRSERLPRNVTAFAVSVSAVLALGATAAGIVRGSTSSTALLFVAITAGTAIGFPWGARAQAAFVAMCALLLAWNDYAIPEPALLAVFGPATAAMLTAGLVSIFVAHSVERYRWQIEQREMGLRQREEHFRSLLENGGDLIVVVGADGTIRYVSPSLQPLLGHEPNAWLGLPLVDVVHPDDVPRLREALAASVPEDGAVQSVEVRIRDAAQTWRVLDGAIANLLANAAVRGFVFNARDVTQRRQMETDLRRNQAELTHVLRLGTISEIAAALAHEINQPLAAISNYASACTRRIDAGAGSSPELRQGLQLIAAEALRAGRIVHGLRDLSRKGDAGMEAVDVNDVVLRAAELMKPQARLQGIALRVQTSEDRPSVHAVAIQIEQVVLNVLLNGIESMQSSRIKVLSASIACVDRQVEVCVRDTGVGLDPAVGARVFEPFFTTKPTGLGMGLAISRRIIEAHGGEFRGVCNPDGRGSTFSFTLPLAPQQQASKRLTRISRNEAEYTDWK
jgi:two-component system sensor kinase FixL